jgi:cation diffusion facilitator CzcD-associated flavoprotein CzcO
MSNPSNYDIIIIGGGISGLYSAYKILQMAPETKLLVLER